MSQVTPSNQYAVGQLWACQGRQDGEQPTLLINRIDQHPLAGGNIYHVTLDGLKIRNPRVPEGVMTQLAHAPVTDQTLQRSQLRLLGQQAADPAYLQGYGQWREAFDAGNAGSFGVSVATILEIVERQLNGTPLDQP
ncbi:MAG: hypothetical protein DI584_14360 [Stenotrophomonas sp.]|jgi:hypothetical protein|nr:MAG: hypothetical protein DI584_14360 [Stenotrophomonas sp.]